MNEVRRSEDDELCGFVDERDGAWHACTIFGGELGIHDTQAAATGQVLDQGLASLAERWTLRNAGTGDEEVVCIQEVNASQVTLALGPYTAPSVPLITLTVDQLRSGDWVLHL